MQVSKHLRNFSNQYKGDHYDNLCQFYRNCKIPPTDTPKHVYFATYIHQLAINLASFLSQNITSYAPKDIKKIFNIKDYDSIMGIKRVKNEVILPATTPLSSTPTSIASTTIPKSSTPASPKHPLNLILYGPPGTGKTYNTMYKALSILGEDLNDSYEQLKTKFDDYLKRGQIVFTTFHQSMSYEDFIEGIKPMPVVSEIVAKHEYNNPCSNAPQFGNGKTTIANLSRMKYEVKDGIFKKLCDIMAFLKSAMIDNIDFGNNLTICRIEETKVYCVTPQSEEFPIEIDELFSILKKKNELKLEEDPKLKQEKSTSAAIAIAQKFLENKKVIIIDEINRGNVAQIFGELITLIEKNKRLGNEEAMTATLPYSQKPFGVPNNLYIIGTMNTADRSVEALDTALRRRFSFEEMMPKPELLENITVCGVKLNDLLKTINKRIVALKNREYQIGHSYFMGSDKENNKEEWLTKVFKDKIIPLLQEYFYGDYKKIYYVLGEGFVKKIIGNKSDVFSVEIDDDFDIDDDLSRYEIKSFENNAGQDDKIDIEEAVKSLVKSVNTKITDKREIN